MEKDQGYKPNKIKGALVAVLASVALGGTLEACSNTIATQSTATSKIHNCSYSDWELNSSGINLGFPNFPVLDSKAQAETQLIEQRTIKNSDQINLGNNNVTHFNNKDSVLTISTVDGFGDPENIRIQFEGSTPELGIGSLVCNSGPNMFETNLVQTLNLFNTDLQKFLK